MKKKLMILAALLALSLSAADSLPDLDWKVLNGKMANWSGNVEPLPDGGMVLKGKNCISFSKRKYLVGDKRKARMRFSVQGYGSSIGIYCYGKDTRLLGQFQERLPNAEDKREFEAVFEIPKTMKGKEVASFRVFFSSSEGLKLFSIKMCLEN